MIRRLLRRLFGHEVYHFDGDRIQELRKVCQVEHPKDAVIMRDQVSVEDRRRWTHKRLA
jgi:hypothetical protein